ncbi:excalibur calcium-binding domain-containing protein [Bacillus sp. 1P06AnD]
MKNIRRIIIGVILLIMLLMGLVVPISYIGTIVFLIGLYLMYRNKKGKVTFKKPGWLLIIGFILFFVLGIIFVDKSEIEEVSNNTKKESISENNKSNETKQKAKTEEKARIAAEQKAKAEAEEKAKIAAEQKAKAEAEERARIAAEQKTKAEAEEKARIAAEQKAKAEAEERARIVAEQKAKAEEKARIATEQKAKAEADEKARIAAQQSANNTSTSDRGNESFKNCTELRKVYPNGVPSSHPAYEPRLDRDKDNFACER